jgi:hypothetical protein
MEHQGSTSDPQTTIATLEEEQKIAANNHERAEPARSPLNADQAIDMNANEFASTETSRRERESILGESRAESLPVTGSGYESHSALFWRTMHLLALAYFIPTTIALVVVIAIDSDKPCDKPPLKTWAMSQAVIQLLIIFGQFSLWWRGDNREETGSRNQNQLYFFTRFLNFLWLMWFTVGIAWIFQSHNPCQTSAPTLYKTVLALLIMELTIISLSFILCCCSFPLLWLLYLWNPSLFGDISSRGERADKKMIGSVTEIKQFKEGSMTSEDAVCAICLANYRSGDNIRWLRCNHHFHQECVDQWLKKYRKSCPFCKTDIDAEAKSTEAHIQA